MGQAEHDHVDAALAQAVPQVGAGERQIGGQQPYIEERVWRAEFPRDKRRGSGERDTEGGPVRTRQGQQEDEQGGHRTAEAEHTGHVDPGEDLAEAAAADRVRVLRYPQQRHREGQARNGDVDQERGPPVEPADEQPADGGPDRDRRGTSDRQASQDTGRRGIQPSLSGSPAQQQHRRRVAGRRAEPDEDPGHDQRGQVPGESADDPGHQHGGGTGQEHTPRAELFGEPAGGGLSGGTGQVQAGDQDRGLPHRYAQRDRDRYQRGRDDRAVDGVERGHP